MQTIVILKTVVCGPRKILTFINECCQQHSFKTNVRCGVFDDEIVVPYFFKESFSNNLNEVLDNMLLNVRRNFWYKHDGTPVLKTAATSASIK